MLVYEQMVSLVSLDYEPVEWDLLSSLFNMAFTTASVKVRRTFVLL
jgi:hypothetical protein